MGTRFMCTKESTIHENIKRVIVDSDERSTTHSESDAMCCLRIAHVAPPVLRSLRNSARMHKNKISVEVLE